MGVRDVAAPVAGPLPSPSARQSRSWGRRATTSLLWWVVSLAILVVLGAVLLAVIRLTNPKVVPYTFDWRVVSERGFLTSCTPVSGSATAH